MAVPSSKIEDIEQAATELVDAARELLDLRDSNADASAGDREPTEDANDEFEAAARNLVALLPPSLRA